MDRRSLMRRVLHAVAAVVVAAAALPSLVTAVSPAWSRRRGPRWEAVGPLSEFAVGQTREALVRRSDDEGPLSVQAVYVWRPAAEEVVVFSRACTDLGCPVNWDPGSRCFFCPCHGGIFARDGERMAGPPRRPLYRFAARVARGVLEIDLDSVPPIA